jgi:hypothetical protein
LFGAFALASGCVANGTNDGMGPPVVMEAGLGGATNVIAFDGGRVDAQMAHEDGTGLDSRCGTADYCHGKSPDDPEACDGYGLDSGGPARRHDAGTHHIVDASIGSGDASAALDGGADGGDASHFADARPNEPQGSVTVVRSLPIPEPLPPPPDAGARYSCQVARDNSGGPVHQCAPSGTRGAAMPCDSSSDCLPGFACVGTTHPGLCLQYCCDPMTTCRDPGVFCASRPLIEDSSQKKPLVVPVCAPADDCALLEPFPCTGACTCTDPTTTCTVVRADGTRGCVTPGTGKVNDKCGRPDLACAAGYYCSLATSLCVKMCKTDGVDTRCSPGKCQAAAGFPEGFGLCVGYPPSMQ